MNSKYLIEIGVEELPYKFVSSGLHQLKSGFKKLLDDNKLKYSEIKTYGTPNRLTLIIEGLESKQADEIKEIKGPVANIAYDEQGNLTQAGLGFARKNGVSATELFKKDNYVMAKIEQKGKSSAELIQNSAKDIVLKLQGSHFMRWASLDVKFQRPIRWIVSLFDDENLEIEIANIKSSKTTRGHRFSELKEFGISSIDNYVDDLYKANVIVDQNVRKEKIRQLATEKAKSIGAKVFIDEELLEEVTYLTQWCVPILCDFDEKYLSIPQKVLTTVMASHQRYFPIFKDGKLLNKFITIANYVGDKFENIKRGNEKVIKARFDDAIFFFNEDTKKPLKEYLKDLKGVTFQKGLGSMYNKTIRIVELSKFIEKELDIELESIEQTATLCKCDLVTQLVFEFTELQGFIGSDYAKKSNESEAVVTGIKEHYFPLNANSETASSIEGGVVGIADKIDTITSTFASGQKPTGSADPLGIRRATLGVLKTMLSSDNLNFDLTKLIKKSIEILPIEIQDKNTLFEEVKEFFEQRLLIFYAETHRKDVLEACISNSNALSNLKRFTLKVQNLSEFVKSKEYEKFHESANRIIRILKNDKINQLPNKGLFNNPAESTLFDCAIAIDESKLRIDELTSELTKLVPHIEKFFEDVLVMDKDENIKNNRLALLSLIKNKFDKLADFSKVVF